MTIPLEISCESTCGKKTAELTALLDTGAGGKFIDQNYAKEMKMKTIDLEHPLKVYNVDGTPNKRGTIRRYVTVDLTINGRKKKHHLFVTGLGRQKVILGYPWFKEENPDIDWERCTLTWRMDERDPRTPLDEKLAKRMVEQDPRIPPFKNVERGKTLATAEPNLDTDDLSSTNDPILLVNQTTAEPNLDTDDLSSTNDPVLSVNQIEVGEYFNDDHEVWINVKTNLATELKIEDDKLKVELPIEEIVPKDLHGFLDVFDEDKSNRLPDSRSWDHKIEMKEGFEPKSSKVYNLTPGEQIEMDKFLKENLEKGYIRPSQSPMASPFFFVAKKDGRLRPCQDYRYLNDWTIKNAYPLPLISEIMDKLGGAKFFTKFDLKGAYNNVRIREGDEWKAAFKTNRGLFEPTVMFFGMCNSPATFQAMMDSIFATEIENNEVIVYIDDILVFAKDMDDLIRKENIVLDKLRKNDLFARAKKCEFRKIRTEYLGLILEEGKLSMDTTKLEGIRNWPTPTTVREIRSFLGFGNFYRRFIKGFSTLAQPLNDLLKKDQKFEWTSDCQKAFNMLKQRFTEEPVLMMPDHSRPFQIETDASKYATGAILTQLDSNGERHPVAFISKTLSAAERNYDTHDRELLAIVRALEEWRHYIQGSSHTTTVYSDHQNLTYFKNPQNLNRRQARWSLYISEFDLKLVHIPGTKNVLADALSRRPDLCPEDDDNKDVVLLPDHLFVNLIDQGLQKQISESDDMDYDAAAAIKGLLERGPKEIRHDLDDWKIEDYEGRNILFYKGKNYIPKNDELRRGILQRYHDHGTAGHPGELQTFNAVREYYWWPGMRTFVKKYVQGCGTCQQYKIDRNPSKPAFRPVEAAKSTRPFSNCSMDLITDLPPVDGCDSILVVVDQGLTKGVILIPTTKMLTADDTGQLLLDNLYKRFGLPDKIISDRGPQFAAQSFRELLKLLGIKSSLTTAYHPQSDGATERTNQEIEAYLSIYCSTHPETWKESLPMVEFTHNNRRHADRLKTPFELMLGESPLAIPITFENTKYPSVEERIKNLVTSREEALAAHELARNRMADRIKSNFTPFKKGQLVWLDARNLKTTYHKKMAPKREGPFEIEEVLGPLTYRLKLPISWKIHRVFHAVLLRPYSENEIYGENYPRPPPEIEDGEEVYEVETILKHRRRGRGYQYYVKWTGYPITEASWEPEQGLAGASDLLATYKQQHQL